MREEAQKVKKEGRSTNAKLLLPISYEEAKDYIKRLHEIRRTPVKMGQPTQETVAIGQEMDATATSAVADVTEMSRNVTVGVDKAALVAASAVGTVAFECGKTTAAANIQVCHVCGRDLKNCSRNSHPVGACPKALEDWYDFTLQSRRTRASENRKKAKVRLNTRKTIVRGITKCEICDMIVRKKEDGHIFKTVCRVKTIAQYCKFADDPSLYHLVKAEDRKRKNEMHQLYRERKRQSKEIPNTNS
jgi:hypothetical protein